MPTKKKKKYFSPWRKLLVPENQLPLRDPKWKLADPSGAFKNTPEYLYDPSGHIPALNTQGATLIRAGVPPYAASTVGVEFVPQSAMPKGAGAYSTPSFEGDTNLLPIGDEEGDMHLENPKPFRPTTTIFYPQGGGLYEDMQNKIGIGVHEGGHIANFLKGGRLAKPSENAPDMPGHFSPGSGEVMGPNAFNALLRRLIKEDEASRKEAELKGLPTDLPEEVKNPERRRMP